jgi:hypothetical protein
MEDKMTDRELDQLKAVSEYIKFHIGLYLATPAALAVLAEGLKVQNSWWCIGGIALMVIFYLVSGVSAAWFMGKFINIPWNDKRLDDIKAMAFSRRRRILQHWLYWAGLVVGLGGLVLAKFFQSSGAT